MASFSPIVEGIEPIHKSKDERVKVYSLGRSQSFDPPIVVKEFLCAGDSDIEKAWSEFRIAKDLRHDHIILPQEICKETTAGGQTAVYITFEHQERNLMSEISARLEIEAEKSRAFPQELLWRYARELLSAFTFLQQRGIAHRDVKPHNILITPSGALKVCDFGFAKIVSESQSIPATLLGTELYMSPALRVGLISGAMYTADVEHNAYKSDVYSLGMTLLHLSALTLKPEVTVLHNLQKTIDDFIREEVEPKGYSEDWLKLLRRMLEVEEGARPDFLQLEQTFCGPSEFGDDEIIEAQVRSGNELDPVKISMQYGQVFARVSRIESDEVPCLITLEGRVGDPNLRLFTFDLVCVVDESGSMEGDRLHSVKAALSYMLNHLGDRDRMCIIGFSDFAQRKCPLITCTESGKERLRVHIKELQVRDLTNIAAGLKMGMKVIAERRVKNSAVSLLLFSDGVDNYSGRVSEECAEALQDPCENLSVYFFGLGEDADAALFERLGANANYFAHFIKEVGLISQVSSQVFHKLRDVVAREIHIRLDSHSEGIVNCEIPYVFFASGECEFVTNSISAGERKDFVFTLRAHHCPLVKPIRFAPVTASVKFIDVENIQATRNLTPDLKFVPWTEAMPQKIVEVCAHWYRARGLDGVRKIKECMGNGDKRKALFTTDSYIEDLESSNFVENALVKPVLELLQETKKDLASGDSKLSDNRISTNLSFRQSELLRANCPKQRS